MALSASERFLSNFYIMRHGTVMGVKVDLQEKSWPIYVRKKRLVKEEKLIVQMEPGRTLVGCLVFWLGWNNLIGHL